MNRGAGIIRKGQASGRHVLFVGANGRTEVLVDSLARGHAAGCSIEGFLDDDPERRNVLERHGVEYLGAVGELERVLSERVVDCVYVGLPLRSSYDSAQNVVELCERAGVPVRMDADLLGQRGDHGTLWQMQDLPVVSHEAPAREDLEAESGRRWRTYARLTAMLVPFAVLAAAFLGTGTEARVVRNGTGVVNGQGALDR